MDETSENKKQTYTDPKTGKFKAGNPGGGRPPNSSLTPEQKLERKALKTIIAEYRDKLSDSLSLIEPVLVAKALEADVQAIKEIHDRVMGKAQQNIDLMSDGEKISFNIVSYKENGHNDSTSLPPAQAPTETA